MLRRPPRIDDLTFPAPGLETHREHRMVHRRGASLLLDDPVCADEPVIAELTSSTAVGGTPAPAAGPSSANEAGTLTGDLKCAAHSAAIAPLGTFRPSRAQYNTDGR